jgi:hypothetical protein
MNRSLFGRPGRYEARRRGRRWPRSRAAGCLLWIVLLIAILIVLSVLFGGFQKGTKSNGLGYLCPSCTSAPMVALAGPGQRPMVARAGPGQ